MLRHDLHMLALQYIASGDEDRAWGEGEATAAKIRQLGFRHGRFVYEYDVGAGQVDAGDLRDERWLLERDTGNILGPFQHLFALQIHICHCVGNLWKHISQVKRKSGRHSGSQPATPHASSTYGALSSEIHKPKEAECTFFSETCCHARSGDSLTRLRRTERCSATDSMPMHEAKSNRAAAYEAKSTDD